MKEYKEIYAVDLDGTLCEGSRFPTMGNPNYYLIEFLKEKRNQGDIVILWTCREGRLYRKMPSESGARKYGLEFDYINENTKENLEKIQN